VPNVGAYTYTSRSSSKYEKSSGGAFFYDLGPGCLAAFHGVEHRQSVTKLKEKRKRPSLGAMEDEVEEERDG